MSVVEKCKELIWNILCDDTLNNAGYRDEIVKQISDAGLLAQEWRPIAEAPRDVEIIYLAYRNGSFVSSCKWASAEDGGPGWWDEAMTEWVTPRYWMPLPQPPEKETE